MIKGKNVLLRPIRDEGWSIIEDWGKNREAFWGPYQRFQMDHLPLLQEAFQKTGLLSREGGLLLIETIEGESVVGFVRYSMLAVPDADHPYPEIGFGVPEIRARGKGYGKEGIGLLVEYLFCGYPTERIGAFTDIENKPAQRLMENLGFQREGVIRKGFFRDGDWHDIALYSVLRGEFKGSPIR
jgi:aminoglycoside 6'-N-acetyltransferase